MYTFLIRQQKKISRVLIQPNRKQLSHLENSLFLNLLISGKIHPQKTKSSNYDFLQGDKISFASPALNLRLERFYPSKTNGITHIYITCSHVTKGVIFLKQPPSLTQRREDNFRGVIFELTRRGLVFKNAAFGDFRSGAGIFSVAVRLFRVGFWNATKKKKRVEKLKNT